VFLLSLCLLAGLGQLLTGDRPGSVEASVPEWMATMWGFILTVGAISTLAGVFWRGTNRDGQMVEALGRLTFSPPALAYAAVIAATQPGTMGWLAAAPFVGFAASSLWRVAQIAREIGGLRSILRTMDDAQRRRDEP
jgi:hypothetical protein